MPAHAGHCTVISVNFVRLEAFAALH